jgi:hypothetical protein
LCLTAGILGLNAKRTRPYTPRINGKTKRFIKTLLNEWACGLSFQSSEEPPLVELIFGYKGSSLEGRPPFSSSDFCGLLSELLRKHIGPKIQLLRKNGKD